MIDLNAALVLSSIVPQAHLMMTSHSADLHSALVLPVQVVPAIDHLVVPDRVGDGGRGRSVDRPSSGSRMYPVDGWVSVGLGGGWLLVRPTVSRRLCWR